MKIVARIIVIWLALFVFTASAQDEATIRVTGSRVVVNLLEQIFEASEMDVNFNFEVTGILGGFSAFCSGETDLTGSTQPLSLDEETQCLNNEIQYSELLLGYNAIALVIHPQLEAIDCLNSNDLSTIFSPSSETQITEWNQTRFADIEDPISIYLPADNTPQYALFEDIIGGIGVRRDAILEPDPAAIMDAVGSTPGAIGVVNINALQESNDVKIIELQNPELGSCYAPSDETIENRQYSGVDRLFVYVNQSILDRVAVTDVLTSIFGGGAEDTISDANLTAPSENIYRVNASIITGEKADGGRQFSTDVAGFKIPENLFGTIEIGGASNLFTYIDRVTTQFSLEYPGVTVNTNILGEPGGLRQLCNDQVSIMTAFRSLPSAAVENCTANNIETYEIPLGIQAVVLLAHTSDDYLTCLTTEQILTIWGGESTDVVTTWDIVDENFPEEPIILVAPNQGNPYVDLLLKPHEGSPISMRLDTAETNTDEHYRATAINTVTGSLTFMGWQEYLSILENFPENVQLVKIDSGDGCVAPTQETIENFSYPYTQGNRLIVNQNDLSRSEIQSLLWYMFSDENFSFIENTGLAGIEFGELPEIREELQSVYADALAKLAVPDTPSENTPADQP